jgi:hypothetical protein
MIKFEEEHLASYAGQNNYELGLYKDGEIMGYAQYTVYKDEITVGDIFVRPDRRREGFGSMLIKKMKSLHPEAQYKPSLKTDLGANFVHKDITLNEKILNEQLTRIKTMMGLPQNVINEYVTRDAVYLKDYLSMSEEARMEPLPYEYYYFFEDFLIEVGEEFEMPKETRPSNYQDEPYEEVDMFDNNLELITWLEKNNRELYNKFAKYLYDKIESGTLPIDDSEYPAWTYFDNSPQIIKNQWLIHFTKDAEAIQSDGFKYGVDDMTRLGLTTRLGEFDKQYGGYNFAYTLSDFPRYAKSDQGWRDEYKYGDEVVVFNASGIRVWHHGDGEPQVIFYGNTAKNIIPIISGEHFKWGIYSKSGKLLFEHDELTRMVEWLVKNYAQYRKQLV